jgi:hypothetical protein
MHASQIDRSDIGAVITAMYATISGPAGVRDWSQDDIIFHPSARLVRTGLDEEGRPTAKVMTLKEYQAHVAPIFAQMPFYESEIARKLDVFGNIAHAWSAYEARRDPSDAAPERRGVNSIQLVRDEAGNWRILAMVWDNEREGLRIGEI